MVRPSRLLCHRLCSLVVLLVVTAGPAPGAEPPTPEARPDSASLHAVLPDLVVSSEAVAPPDAGLTTLPPSRLDLEDAGSVAELGRLLPSTRVSVNSRGESVLMIRGAPERHVQTFLDGIPVNLPWDERVDLGTIPVSPNMQIVGRRGLSSLLEGPGALAGSVRLTPGVPARGEESHTRASLGQNGLSRLQAHAGRDFGAWRMQGGLSWENRDSWRLPGGESRFNSDLDRTAILLRAGRPVAGFGRLNLLLTRWRERRGVPPELHLGDEARFWRYPLRERILGGVSLDLPLSADGAWDLRAMVAADDFNQEIDPRGPDHWGDPLASGQDYEHDRDRTYHAMTGLTRWLGERSRLTLQANRRSTTHRENLAVGDPQQTYRQDLTSLVSECEWEVSGDWSLRAGAGWDHAGTPRTGDKPGRAAEDAAALSLRLERSLGSGFNSYAAASRRSRFPSLRELFSGAIGKFVPNPALQSERQDLVEAGLTARGSWYDLAAAAFLQNLHGGIEKERLADGSGRFMRVNRTRIRLPGLELITSFKLRPDWSLSVQHTFLWARVQDPTGGFTMRAEDRPDWISALALTRDPKRGWVTHLVGNLTGPRWSSDPQATAMGGLKRLPAAVTWDLRLGYRWRTSDRTVGIHLKADNLFDAEVFSQTGLPQPGRTVSGGVSLDL